MDAIFADNSSKYIFLNENVWIPIKISLKFVPNGLINNIQALVQIVAWYCSLFTQSFIQMQIKENIKAPRHWPLWGEFTGERWIPRTNGQLRGKCFHLMMSSCSGTGLSSVQYQAIIYTNVDLLSIMPQEQTSVKLKPKYKSFLWRKCIWVRSRNCGCLVT